MAFLLNIEKLWVPVPTPSPTLWRSFALSRPPVVPLQRKCFIGWDLRSRDSSGGSNPCLQKAKTPETSPTSMFPDVYLTPSHIVQSTLSIATQNDFSWNMVYLLNICRYIYIIYIYICIICNDSNDRYTACANAYIYMYVCIHIYIYICTHSHSCHPFAPDSDPNSHSLTIHRWRSVLAHLPSSTLKAQGVLSALYPRIFTAFIETNRIFQ